ncbi:hypothetical protein IJ843_02980 [bacterium]|nr:hypothetical protein [bacterium]
MKYSFNYDNFKIDTKNKFLTINNKQILFKDINYITVRELEQPSISEKLLTKGALCTFNAEALLQMKDGTIEKCKFNYKGILYKFLKTIQPFVKIEEDISCYKQIETSNFLIFLILLIVSIWVIFKL